jgi:hypothetical protein
MGNAQSRIGDFIGKGVDTLHKINPFLRKTHEVIAGVSQVLTDPKHGAVPINSPFHQGIQKAAQFSQKVWHLGTKMEQAYNFTTAIGRLFTVPKQQDLRNEFTEGDTSEDYMYYQ